MNKYNNIALLIILALFVSCDNFKLNKIEKASKNFQSCLVHQIIPNECDSIETSLEIAELKAIQAEISEERINASIKIGEKSVSGEISNSPYNRIRRALNSYPFYITPTIENYKPFKTDCFTFHKSKANQDEQDFITYFIAYAYKFTSTKIKYYFVKTSTVCRPTDYSNISDEFPIITEKQKDFLSSDEYLDNYNNSEIKSVELKVYDNIELAQNAYLKDSEN